MKKGKVLAAVGLLAAFMLWTAIVSLVDVRPVGPQGSRVGLAAINQLVHERTGVHMMLYHLTDWLSVVPLGIAAGFASLGLAQWIRRKRLNKVDGSLLVLGGFYLAVMAAYVFFEAVIVNYRPVLIEGKLEASYPSSTTMLVLCMIPTAVMQLQGRIRNQWLRNGTTAALVVFLILMVTGRIISGVHWITDIIGAALLSAGLVMMYHACTSKS
ncbi:MAG: phosphatase PAP2 family protein [Clostridia bacterium]|nr:phosphatase PAP2 family protein [Clostridia bacterium]